MFNLYNQQPEEQKTSEKKEELPKADFRKYEDPSGDFDTKELRYSMWWVAHKVLLYRLAVFALLGINVIFWGYSVGRWGAYVFGITDQKLVEIGLTRFANYSKVNEAYKPKPLQIGATNIFGGGVKKVDLVSEITNPNVRYNVTLSYYMVSSVSTGTPQEVTILAGQSGIAAVLGIPEDQINASAALQIDNIRWQRISPHKIKDPIAWQNERLNFKVSNFAFNTPFSNADLKTNQITFTLKNESAYAYKQPKFLVGLYNQNTLVGVSPLQLDDMYSMEERQVDIRNFSNNLQVNDVTVFPLINVYDKSVFLSPKAE